MVKALKRNHLIVLAVLSAIFLLAPTVSSKEEGTPFNELWDALNELASRVTALETGDSGLSLVYYYDSHPGEISAPPRNPINYQLYEFTLEPASSVNTLWQVQVELEHKDLSGDEYLPHTIIIILFDDDGEQLAYWEQASSNLDYLPISVNFELDPFHSRDSESYRLDIWVEMNFPYGWPSVRNIELTFAVFE